MGILSGNPKDEPLHYGEVTGLWAYLSTTKGLIAAYQTFVNHTGDQDLRRYVELLIGDMKQEVKQVEEVLKVNGVALPPTPPERPTASLESIPAGARINDSEVAAAVSRDIAAGMISCSAVIGQCIREDVAMLFSKFHTAKVQNGATLLRISKEKGWLVPPPLHLQTPEPAHV